ncbi:MAG: sugar phosphate isomerase/epimerase family protein [Candidatus Nanopelagicales bacterium]
MTPPASSAQLTPADFAFSYNCLGDIDYDTRFAAAKAAGFKQIGINLRHMGVWLTEHSLDELDALLAKHDLVVGEMEAVRLMLAERDPREETAAIIAERYRPLRLQATGPYEGTLAEAAERAGRVADRFAQWGVEVVLEPLPFTNMKTPAIAAEICELAGRPNLSICMDVWHLYRNGLTVADLEPAWKHISTVQFNDGTVIAENDDLLQDCLDNRRVPNAGEFDLVGLLRARDAHRPDSTFSIEVINSAHAAKTPQAVAQSIADGITAVVAKLQ